MKRLTILFFFVTGLLNAQPQLSITGYSSYTQTSFSTNTYLVFYNVTVANTDSFATFNDSLYIALGVEDPPGTVTFVAACNDSIQIILPLSSIVVDSAYFIADTTLFLKDGNNTVVIWPFALWGSPAVTKDSLYTEVWIEIGGSTGTVIEKLTDDIPIKIGPNPASQQVFLNDPENILRDVRISSIDGKRMPCMLNKRSVDVSLLPKGVYIIEIETSRGRITRKLIVER